LFSFNSNTTDVTSGAGTGNPSEPPDFNSDILFGSCYSTFSTVFCRSLFVLLSFLLVMILSVLQNYSF
jgi:hypothetical protein